MSESDSKNGGIGISTTVFIIFLTLKLCKIGSVADWSWWWVTSPLWIPLIIMLIIIIIVIILSFIVKVFDK
jgi:hypothetical protein